jgi:hypothetical protein
MVMNYFEKIVSVVNTLLRQTIGSTVIPRCDLRMMRYPTTGKQTQQVSFLLKLVKFGQKLYFSDRCSLINR